LAHQERPTDDYCWKKLIGNINTVVVADGGGNQDKEAIANESWVASNVLFSKNGHREKAKPGKEMACPGCIRI